jgi:hypothetical protein
MWILAVVISPAIPDQGPASRSVQIGIAPGVRSLSGHNHGSAASPIINPPLTPFFLLAHITNLRLFAALDSAVSVPVVPGLSLRLSL